MKERMQDRLFAACGIAAVVLQLAGLLLNKTEQLGDTASTAKIAHALAMPVGTGTWVGAYVEIASFGFFLAFAAWATGKLGDGLLARIARAAATSYATLSIAALGVVDAVAYRAGDGLTVPIGRALLAVNGALYVASWFLVALFLLANGLLALARSRRVVGWSAIAVAIYTLAAIPSINNLGQFAILLFFIWVIGTSIALARSKPDAATALVAQHA